MYGNQIGELYHSLPYDMIEFVLDDFEWLDHFLVSLPFIPLESRKVLYRFHYSISYDSFLCIMLLRSWNKHFFFSYCSKVVVTLRYADLISVLPSRIKVLAWPTYQSKKFTMIKDENGMTGPIPARLSYAEDALRTMSLPEGIASL